VKIRDRIVELRRVRAADLHPNPKNWRTHPKAQREALRGVLAEIGYADALLARETPVGLQIIDGHLRAETTPDVEVPVLILDVTEAEADKLLATLDPLAALAEGDPESLRTLLEQVETDSDAVKKMLDNLAMEYGAQPGPKPLDDPGPNFDEAEELRKKWGTELGQLWTLGEHRLLCGDCTDPASVAALIDGDLAQCMWTDPPYGVDYEGGTGLSIENDDAEGIPDLLERAWAVADKILVSGAPIYVCHPAGPLSVAFGKAFLVTGWRLHETLVWVKSSLVLGHSDYHYRHEPILYGWKGKNRPWYGARDQTSVLEFDKPSRNELHPTIKPVELVDACLTNSTKQGDIVYEPFSGSGTTLISCERLSRSCRAVELSPGYVAAALERWSAATGRQPTVAGANAANGASSGRGGI
jgi:DNA modification methylase